YMVTGSLMKIIYSIGLAVITASGGLMILSGFGTMAQGNNPYFGQSMAVAGLFTVISGLFVIGVGNLLWRIACETWVVLFSMHEIMSSIERLMRHGAEGAVVVTTGQSTGWSPGSGAQAYAPAAQPPPPALPFPTSASAPAPAPRPANPGHPCPRCGAQVRTGVAFCGNCGTQVPG
ncbi:MAG: DUF4282 domain-containing protein, partial [Blastocatellia bacterium]